MRDLLQDLRFGARMLRKRPGTSVLAALALALGIGLTTTMFSIVNGAFLRGLPFEASHRILHLSSTSLGQSGGRRSLVSLHDFVDWQRLQQSFEALSGFYTTSADISSEGAMPERYRGAVMTTNTLSLLRTAPIAGRDFTDADGRPGAPAVALIGYRIWTDRFHQDSTVIGRTILINNQPTTIAGVMAPRFGFPETGDVWLPLHVVLPPKRGDGEALEVVGRLRVGAAPRAAAAEMLTIARRLEQQYPENKGLSVTVESYLDYFLGPIVATLSAMLAAVFGVLLIACVNVTNLQLARAADRMREVAVRTALGASRGRIVRQLLVEGLLLSVVGAAVGVAIAQVGVTLFNWGIADTEPPFWIDIRIDTVVLAFVLGITILATLASSLVPALRVSRQHVNDVLKDEGRASTGLRIGRISRALVVAEMTFSFCLLVVSGLMMKGLVTIGTISYPFAADQTFMGRLHLGQSQYAQPADLHQVMTRLQARVAAVPGVRALAIATDAPGDGAASFVLVDGQPAPPDAQRPNARRIAVSPDYFDVLQVSVTKGRALAASDRDGTTPVTVVSDDFARKFFPKGDAIGRRIQIGRDPKGPWWTVVGLVPSLAVLAQPGQVTETVYVPVAQTSEREVYLLASTAGPPTAVTSAVRQAIMDIDRGLPLSQVSSLRGFFAKRTWPFRVFGSLFMTFGCAALVLAAAGLYGVMAFGVRRRSQEIGLRMALGADRGRVVRMIAWQGLVQVAFGMAIGLVLGRLLAGQLTLLLFRVSPWDPTVFGLASVVLGLTGLVATLVPATRAASIDPLAALRHD